MRSAELVSIPEAARRLGVGRRQVRRAVAEGELPVYRVGAWPRVRWADVERWIERRRTTPTAHAEARLRERLAYERGRAA